MATGMRTLREHLLHGLGQLLAAERQLAGTLAKLTEEAVDEELRQVFAEHLEQTRRHLVNVEKAFALLGEEAREEPSAGIENIVREHDEFVARKQPSTVVLDMFLTGAGARAEHYEIAAYEGVVAAAVHEDEAAALLRRNLDEEQEALAKPMHISERLTTWALGKKPGVVSKLKEHL